MDLIMKKYRSLHTRDVLDEYTNVNQTRNCARQPWKSNPGLKNTSLKK